MFTILKIISGLLVLVMFGMGIRNGWSTFTEKPEALALFDSLGISKNLRLICSIVTLGSAFMLLHPKTFVWGVYLQLSVVMLLTVMHIHLHHMKGFLIELPIIGLFFLILYLGHPFSK
ncbi:MAG: hypothetical protein ACRCVT_01860 [Leadbetterella sp.]